MSYDQSKGGDKHNKKSSDVPAANSQATDSLRVEHLNYKRLIPGQRVLCSVVSVRALELIVALPNQLLGHIPITSISSHFTQRLAEEAQDSDEDSDDEDSDEESNDLPELKDWFKPGQLLTAAVVNIKSADLNKKSIVGSRKDKIDEEVRWSRRLELSLDPARVNEGVKKEDLVHNLVSILFHFSRISSKSLFRSRFYQPSSKALKTMGTSSILACKISRLSLDSTRSRTFIQVRKISYVYLFLRGLLLRQTSNFQSASPFQLK